MMVPPVPSRSPAFFMPFLCHYGGCTLIRHYEEGYARRDNPGFKVYWFKKVSQKVVI